uniref:Uncharacterized protein n=1 Tax=Arundo donax TaxID=35708 RepID=A0A0A9GD80_ARUDO
MLSFGTLHSLNSMHLAALYIRWLNEMQQLLVCCSVSRKIVHQELLCGQ